MNLAEILASTADPAFASDERGRIVEWNRGAEDLLGYRAEEVKGRPCHDILHGCDVFGNRYCDEACAIVKMAGRREPVRHFEIEVRKASGESLRVGISVLVIGEPPDLALLHLLLPASTGSEPEIAARPTTDPAEVLTPREVEVLRLLAAGNSSQDIAGQLTVSLTTVRTHVQNILRKLEVHSQLEAVSLAFRTGLI